MQPLKLDFFTMSYEPTTRHIVWSASVGNIMATGELKPSSAWRYTRDSRVNLESVRGGTIEWHGYDPDALYLMTGVVDGTDYVSRTGITLEFAKEEADIVNAWLEQLCDELQIHIRMP